MIFGKIIIDNRDNVQPFYDGLSMGCGEIHFECSTCGHDVREETLLFERANERISIEEREYLKNFFNVVKNPYYNQTSSVGFMRCSYCNSEFALYIASGEVQMGRYQASLVAVVECFKREEKLYKESLLVGKIEKNNDVKYVEEVTLDFKNITTMNQLIIYASKMLKLSSNTKGMSWYAFRDDFWTILYKEYTEYIQTDWKSYDDFEKAKKLDSSYGLKNREGVRDDLTIFLINFTKFKSEYPSIANEFLNAIFETIEEVNSDEWRVEGMMNSVDIKILS